jgi:hypothetical protein
MAKHILSLAERVKKRLEGIQRSEWARDYIGASVVAHVCGRALFYMREKAPASAHNAQTLRIFDFGNTIEDLVVCWLREAGFQVYDKNPVTGDQFRFYTPEGAVLGHADGVLSTRRLVPDLYDIAATSLSLLEIKSHNQRNFDQVVNLGVERGKFEHYAQMQCYLADDSTIRQAFGTPLLPKECLYVAVNKNDCEVYVEQVAPNRTVFLQCLSRIRSKNSALAPPPRIASSAEKSPCKWCGYKIHCWQDDRQTAEMDFRASSTSGGGNVVSPGVSQADHFGHSEW